MSETTNHSPLSGEMAPPFTADTTQGKVSFPDDYKGKWVILFSHPADFTPVCTTEFMTFASMQEEFRDLNCELLGLSIDSAFSHIAWLRTIREKVAFRGNHDVEVTFPVISDLTMEISRAYRMLQPSASTTQAVRAVFLIDPESKVRAILYYPLSNGRNFQEIKRLLLAIQTSDEYSSHARRLATRRGSDPSTARILRRHQGTRRKQRPFGSLRRLVLLLQGTQWEGKGRSGQIEGTGRTNLQVSGRESLRMRTVPRQSKDCAPARDDFRFAAKPSRSRL